MGLSRRGLVVGNYCHDVIFRDAAATESLGGAASFISAVIAALSIDCTFVSKVGHDFKYSVPIPPIVSTTAPTTLFHAHFGSRCPSPNPNLEDRTLKRVRACDPIRPNDLPESERFEFGLAVGVGGEILLETVERMVEICDVVFVDIQGLIRIFDEIDGTVRLIDLKDTEFYRLLPRIGFLKASSEEAKYFDLNKVREFCGVVVTNGENGCKVYYGEGCEVQIPPFRTVQVDPTGAGDSFLGGFAAGLVQGLAAPDAALLGNFFGSLTVEQIGFPTFDSSLLQRAKDEVQKRLLQCNGYHEDKLVHTTQSPRLDQFHASLSAARQLCPLPVKEPQADTHNPPFRTVHQRLNHQCSGQQKLLSHPICEEPLESVELHRDA